MSKTLADFKIGDRVVIGDYANGEWKGELGTVVLNDEDTNYVAVSPDNAKLLDAWILILPFLKFLPSEIDHVEG